MNNRDIVFATLLFGAYERDVVPGLAVYDICFFAYITWRH